jgi:DNA-binding NtrC family response regulator
LAERIVVIADNPQAIVDAVTSSRRVDVRTASSVDDVKREAGVIVLVIEDDRLSGDPSADLERIHERAPGARFVFVNRSGDAERARMLVVLGAVLPLPVDVDRLELAIRQAFALGAMNAKMQAIRGPGRSPTLDGSATLDRSTVTKPKAR